MSEHKILSQRWRAIFDCTLIALIILMAAANHLPAQARPEPQASTKATLAADPMTLTDLNLASSQATPALPELDNNTLAAMIAAENAALTLPLHLVDIPLIIR